MGSGGDSDSCFSSNLSMDWSLLEIVVSLTDSKVIGYKERRESSRSNGVCWTWELQSLTCFAKLQILLSVCQDVFDPLAEWTDLFSCLASQEWSW